MFGSAGWASKCLLLSTTLLSPLVDAYRPVQFVKHTGEAGRADQAFSLTQYYNESTSQNDLWVRMEAFRYNGDSKGWAAMGLGPWMTGALMFILYGDPTAPGGPLTLSVRSAQGHHPPVSLSDSPAPFVPDVDITHSQFEEYTGGFDHADMGKPSHVAVAEFIVRGYDKWHGVNVSSDALSQPFIWSSNFKQDFQGDYSPTRAIDMHMFGLGFGFVFIDLKNAFVPSPFYGEIRDTEGHYGVNEIDVPAVPTDEELAAGEAYISRLGQNPTAAAADTNPTATLSPETHDKPAAAGQEEEDEHDETKPHSHSPDEPLNLRSFFWHIHGSLMILAFMVLYPLGTFLLRSGRPTAFNYHWTIQSLGTASVAISAGVAYMTSHGISIPHQYAGFVIVALLAGQSVLGWRHHVFFVNHKRKNWLSPAHMWLGRVVFPLGFINIFTGLRLRGYGWLTILLVVVVMVLEVVFLFWYIRGAGLRNARIDAGAGKAMGMQQQRAEVGGISAAEEEYFQLAGDDDEFSDSDGEAETEAQAVNRERERREQSKRLAALDKV